VTGANRSNASRRGGSGDLAGMEGGGFLGGFGGLLDLLTARPARRLAARFHRKQAPRQRLPPGALGKGWSMKSGRRAKVQGSGVIRLPWASRINSAFTNSFYSNHVRGRPSVAVSAPILLYIARVTCLSTKQTDQLQKAARSGDA
jgi:hypothetical protein